jgi:hypothetical protein
MVLPIGRVSGERPADPFKQLGRGFRLLLGSNNESNKLVLSNLPRN